jgi:uncharacterized protein YjbI with pentapeptide repeats
MPSKGQAATRNIVPPHLPERLQSTTFPHGMLADHEVYSDAVFAQSELVGQTAQGVTFDTCDFAEAVWDKAQMARIVVVDSRLVGFKAGEARIQDAFFKDCNGTLALFWSSTFKAARFQSCVLREASFYEADISGVVFDRCDLRGADLRGAKVAGADFRGSQVEGMRVEGCDLRGVVIDPSQAVEFAGLLGLVVRWDE